MLKKLWRRLLLWWRAKELGIKRAVPAEPMVLPVKNQNPVVMDLHEALVIKRDIAAAHKLGYKTNYPSERKVLAGFVETYCTIMGVNQVRRFDLAKLYGQYKQEWYATRKHPKDENVAWGKMTQVQKFLEHWRETCDIE